LNLLGKRIQLALLLEYLLLLLSVGMPLLLVVQKQRMSGGSSGVAAAGVGWGLGGPWQLEPQLHKQGLGQQ
jgi:hypothetical protein